MTSIGKYYSSRVLVQLTAVRVANSGCAHSLTTPSLPVRFQALRNSLQLLPRLVHAPPIFYTARLYLRPFFWDFGFSTHGCD